MLCKQGREKVKSEDNTVLEEQMVHSSKARASVRNTVQGRRSHMKMSTSWSKLRWGPQLVDFFFSRPGVQLCLYALAGPVLPLRLFYQNVLSDSAATYLT